MNTVLGGKTPIFLFAEKPAIAPPVFVFQKEKGQKVRGRYVLPSPLPPPPPPEGRSAAMGLREEGLVALRLPWPRVNRGCVDKAQRPC